jgi:hypothetical protein
VAYARLRHGEDPESIAAATKVPLPLVQLLARELEQRSGNT